jgi:hypothetical protein
VWQNHGVLYYQVDDDHFGDTGYQRFFGQRMTMEWGYYNPNTGTTAQVDRRQVTSNNQRALPPCPNFQ